jgi:hypothetical protein
LAVQKNSQVEQKTDTNRAAKAKENVAKPNNEAQDQEMSNEEGSGGQDEDNEGADEDSDQNQD